MKGEMGLFFWLTFLSSSCRLCGIISHDLKLRQPYRRRFNVYFLPDMLSRSTLVLQACLVLLKPLVALLLRHGVAYPAFAAALKKVFLEAAQDELRAQGAALTDSAVSLRSGIHRRDVREITRPVGEDQELSRQAEQPVGTLALDKPMNMATQVVARWLSEPQYLDADGNVRTLPRAQAHDGFDALVASVSSDIRPRAVLDELVRLGLAVEAADGVQLLQTGFAPRQGFAEMAQLYRANLHDHVAAASQNLDGDHNFLEQAIFVDQITAQSVQRLHAVSVRAWRQAFKTVMREAEARFEADARDALPHERSHRARFGAYFYSQQEEHDVQNNHPQPTTKRP